MLDYKRKNSYTNLRTHLYHLGLTNVEGKPEELSIAVLASGIAGDFFDSCGFADKTQHKIQNLLKFDKLSEAALYLLLQYRIAGKTPPDLLFWATASREVLFVFLNDFLHGLQELGKSEVIL